MFIGQQSTLMSVCVTCFSVYLFDILVHWKSLLTSLCTRTFQKTGITCGVNVTNLLECYHKGFVTRLNTVFGCKGVLT